MTSQTRDVAIPAGEDLYTVLHNFTASQLFTFFHDEILDPIIGSFVGILLTGIALTLGVSSILLLSSKKLLSTQDSCLRIYTVVLLLLAVAFQIEMLLTPFGPLTFYFLTFDKTAESKLIVAASATLTFLVGLKDGLLTWRCFMVQRVLTTSPSKWGNLLWIFPALLWLATIAVSITTCAVVFGDPTSDIITASSLATNTLLNLYATIFISIRLLLYRRTIIARLGNLVPTARHIYISGILLESAAINLPTMTACSIGIGIGRLPFANTLVPIAIANQVLGSVLIIHQAALGRILSRQRQCEDKSLVKIAAHNTSQGSEPTV